MPFRIVVPLYHSEWLFHSYKQYMRVPVAQLPHLFKKKKKKNLLFGLGENVWIFKVSLNVFAYYVSEPNS